jgi:GNAT superfamily N-acetyltransferase
MTMGAVFGVKAPEKPKDEMGRSLAQALMSYLQKGGEGAMRGVRAANKALDVSQYVTPSTVAGFLPGAGFVQGAQDAQSAKQAFQAGNYGQAIGFGAQSVLNTGLEALPLTAALPAVAPMKRIANIDEHLSQTYPNVKQFVTDKPGYVVVNKVVVPPEERGRGLGTQVMRDIMEYADSSGKTVALSPSSDFGGNKSQLERWYRSLGFVPNKGKERDFGVMESMIRPKPE